MKYENIPAVLDALRTRYEVPSDNKLTFLLGVSQTCINRLRNEKDTFSDETAHKIAALLDDDPAHLMALAHAMRSKNPEVKKTWIELIKRLEKAPIAVILAFCLIPSIFGASIPEKSFNFNSLQSIHYTYI